jgi:predicted lysophospholipase L1 biosynthesis ABC-type transport system permease subunit
MTIPVPKGKYAILFNLLLALLYCAIYILIHNVLYIFGAFLCLALIINTLRIALLHANTPDNDSSGAYRLLAVGTLHEKDQHLKCVSFHFAHGLFVCLVLFLMASVLDRYWHSTAKYALPLAAIWFAYKSLFPIKNTLIDQISDELKERGESYCKQCMHSKVVI